MRRVHRAVAALSVAVLAMTTTPFVGIADADDTGGYWLTRADGGVFPHGSASTTFGPASVIRGLREPIVGIAPTPSRDGYWLVAADGGVFAFGNAEFFGSMGGQPLNSPIVGMASTVDGGVYWLVSRDGGVFSFGNAQFMGSRTDYQQQPFAGIASSA